MLDELADSLVLLHVLKHIRERMCIISFFSNLMIKWNKREINNYKASKKVLRTLDYSSEKKLKIRTEEETYSNA